MSKQKNTLDKILDYELRPWLPQNSLDDVFAAKFRSSNEYTPKQPACYGAQCMPGLPLRGSHIEYIMYGVGHLQNTTRRQYFSTMAKRMLSENDIRIVNMFNFQLPSKLDLDVPGNWPNGTFKMTLSN